MLTIYTNENIEKIKNRARYLRIQKYYENNGKYLKIHKKFMDAHPEAANPVVLDFGEPSDILKAMGVTKRIMVSQRWIEQHITDPKKHELTGDDLKDIMRHIHNPVMVNKNEKGRILLLTELKSEDGKGKNIVVILDNNFTTNNRADTASVTTAYALNNTGSIVGDIMYVNRKKLANVLSDISESVNRGEGRPLLSYPDYDSSNDSIKFKQTPLKGAGEAEASNLQKIVQSANVFSNKTNVGHVEFQIEGEPNLSEGISAKLNIAPLYSTKVNNLSEANEIFNQDFYKEYKARVSEIAGYFGVTINDSIDGIGSYQGVSEVSTYFDISAGNYNDIVDFAAVMGALTPEVQDATIAALYVDAGSEQHDIDKIEIVIDNEDAAIKALSEAGFDYDGYTIVGGELYLFDFNKGENVEFNNKIINFVNIYEQYGGQIKSKSTKAINDGYINSERRGEILERIESAGLRQQQGGSGFRDVIQEAKARNEAYRESKGVRESASQAEYKILRDKQLQNIDLTAEEAQRIKELEVDLAKL